MTISLSDFGSYTVGGRLHRVTEGEVRRIAVTQDVTLTHDPKGTFAVEHAYVQYFVPHPRRDGPPVILLHGGGLCGSAWETTPDGRPGWLHQLLRRGYEVHVVDNVERGRAGFAPGLWPDEPVLRSLEDAWTLFRIGPPEGFERRRPFAGQQFPAHCLDQFARRFVPRWLSTTPQQSAALAALLDRLGGAIVICHSQGSEPVFDAVAAGAPIHHVIALEPSAKPRDGGPRPALPVTLVAGDYLETAPLWQALREDWDSLADAPGFVVRMLRSGHELQPGHSHLPMLDAGSDTCLEAVLATLNV